MTFMPHALSCPSVWGAYVDVILVSLLPHCCLMPFPWLRVHGFIHARITYRFHALSFFTEPHRLAMWSFAQPTDLPLSLVACLRLPCIHTSLAQ